MSNVLQRLTVEQEPLLDIDTHLLRGSTEVSTMNQVILTLTNSNTNPHPNFILTSPQPNDMISPSSDLSFFPHPILPFTPILPPLSTGAWT